MATTICSRSDNYVLGSVYRNGYGKKSVLEMLRVEQENVIPTKNASSVKLISRKNVTWEKKYIIEYFSLFGVVSKVEYTKEGYEIYFSSPEQAQQTLRVYAMIHSQMKITP